MKIKGFEIPLGYIVFVLTVIVGIMNLCHVLIYTRFGVPNSTFVYSSFIGNIFVTVLAIISPIIGLSSLLYKKADLQFSKFFCLIIIIGASVSLVCIARTGFWLGHTDTEKYEEIKDFTFDKEHKNLNPSKHMIYLSRKFECCGVRSYNDWEEIYKEIDSDKPDDGWGPRKVPDFCCRVPTVGCGSRLIDEIFSSLTQVISSCADPEDDRNDECEENAEILFKSGYPNSTSPAIFDRYEVLEITDPRIDSTSDKSSLVDLESVQEICKNRGLKKKVMVFYVGFVREIEVKYENGLVKTIYNPCYPAEVLAGNLPLCYNATIPTLFFRNSLGFCHWVTDRSHQNDFSLEERITLISADGRIFSNGCIDHFVSYIDRVGIAILIYSLLLLILFISMMVMYNRYYFIFRQDQLKIDPLPRWLDSLIDDGEPPLTAFGDVDFIPDHGCPALPPISIQRVFKH